ncbi:MAG TPA: asparagine synthase (glutamine-hydrolyzing) [Catenuloplanes sp.]
MCGVVGIRRFDGQDADEGLLRRMAARLSHRGPDGEGFLVRGGVGLGHRRLSIIDAEHSAQPMSSPGGDLHVCFNGEIFNYRQLRYETPYGYRTRGDTEVLLANHARHGADGVDRLVGQYAFALYDEGTGDLWLHRDRIGVLPLYYYADSRVFLFASEVKALLAALPNGPEIDPAGVADYLARKSVPAPWTLFRGVRAVLPGHSLRVDARGGQRSHRHWGLPTAAAQQLMTSATAVSLLDSTLTAAVRRSTVADVPVGAYLSGGLDSSLIVAMMSRHANGAPIETFSAGFGDPRFDELPHARRVSELLGTRHHAVRVGPRDVAELWEPLTWFRDAPLAQASDVAVYRLAALARTRVKVVLSGEGADELFGGYPKHRLAAVTTGVGAIPSGLRRALLGPAERALPRGLSRARIAARALAEGSEGDRFEAWFGPFTSRERAALLGGADGHDRHQDLSAHGDPLRRMLVADTTGGWLSDNLLDRGDRMSMACSLELRPPFLDRDLVQLAFTMPSRYKVRHGVGKWVVRQLAHRMLPADVVSRPKVGFRLPLDAWFRTGLRDLARDRLLDRGSLVGSMLDRGIVERLLDDHQSGRRNEESRIWTLLSLEIWHSVFFSGAGRPAPSDLPDPPGAVAPGASLTGGGGR